MIGININGQFLDMGEASVRFEKVNALFTTEVYQGDYSFPFTVPATEKNIRILGFVNRIDTSDKIVDYTCDLYLYNVFYSPAKLIINASTNKTISFNLALGLKSLIIGDKKLAEIDLGTDYALGNDTEAIANSASFITVISDWTTYGFSFPCHYNPDFYGSNNPTFNGIINRVDSTTGKIKFNTTGTGNKYALVPFLFLFYVLSKIFRAEGLTPSGTFWDDTKASKLLLYNNRALDAPDVINSSYILTTGVGYHNDTSRIQFQKGPAGSFDNFGGWDNTSFHHIINSNHYGKCIIDINLTAYISNNLGYDGIYFVPLFGVDLDGVNLGNFNLPSFPGTTQNVQFSVAHTFGPGDLGKELSVYYIHNHPGVTDPYPYPVIGVQPNSSFLLTNVSSQGLNTFSNILKFKNHVPDMTVSEFLAEVKKIGVDININYSDRTVKLNRISDSIKTPLAKDYTSKADPEFELSYDTKNAGFSFGFDWGSDGLAQDNFKSIADLPFKGEYIKIEDLPNPQRAGDIVLIKNLNQYYITVGTSSAFTWEFYSDNYYPVVIGKGETEIKCKLAPMFMSIHGNEGGTVDENAALMPQIKQTGSSEMFGLGINDFTPRLVFYRGSNFYNSIPNPRGGGYIYAGTSVYNINGFKYDAYELAPSMPGSTFEAWLKAWLETLNNGEIVERDFALNPYDILNMDPTAPIITEATLFFIQQISMVISKKSKPSRVKLLKVSE